MHRCPPRRTPAPNLTYTLAYRNGAAKAAAAETGVVIDFTTPPNTTFQSYTPPTGATCTTPAVGAAGTIVCTFSGSVASGASGSFSVTVAIAAGTTGTITAGNYFIRSTQETTLLGPPITTRCGCAKDTDCPAGDWCDESVSTCTATLANGVAVPTDGSHTNPTLNGTCTAAAGTLVCTSAVCDTADNKCGDAHGDGTCTAGNAATVCRSGACSTSGTCEPAGGCDVDADCAAGNWCNETSRTCTAKIANGGAIPTDSSHTNPTLNGTCTVAAGTLVCTSAVCDTADNKCGYANGDGPCTATSGVTVCRSGTCSPGGTCQPPGACNVDADCSAGHFCSESMHLCLPQVANGGAVPTDPPHTNPTLDGTCTTAAGALACASGVCDSDNECGYRNGDGPCVAGDGGASALCRSGLCAPASGSGPVCVACVSDADCSGGQVCVGNACVAPSVDAGSPDSGASDASAGPDAEEDATADAPADAVAEATAGDAALDVTSEEAAADGGPDAAAASTPDASTAEDAMADAEEDSTTHPHRGVTDDGGYIRGGGCSAAAGGGSSSGAPEMAGTLALLGMVAARRRRVRATR